MSWSVTVNDLDQINELPHEIYAKVAEDNPLYAQDLGIALIAAMKAGLVSATLAGGRTPSPYGGPDVVTISVHGFDSRKEGHAVEKSGQRIDYIDEVLKILGYPDPDEESLPEDE